MLQILFIITLLGVVGCSAQAQTLPDQQNKGFYTMNVAGAKVAEESYSLENLPNGVTRQTSEVSLSGNKTVFVTTMKNNRPLEFSIEANNVKALTVAFAGDTVKFTVTGQPEKTIKTAATVILENLAWSHYIQLLSLFEASKSEQKIVALLPNKMLDLHLTVSKTGTESVEINRQKIELEKYQINIAEGNLNVEIWASKNRVPLLIEIPAQQVKVVRRGFEQLLAFDSKSEKAAVKVFGGEFTSEDVLFENGAVKLAGTLTIPKNAQKTFPAVILISGSGGQDRDGSQLFNLYRQIAESLSRAGIAVLRVDDRGNGKSILPAGVETSYRDLIADSRAAFDYLAKRAEIDRSKIAFLGHSEGAETALTLASEDDKRVAAIILLAGSSRPLDEIVLEQEMFQRASTETINVGDKTKVLPLAQTILQQFEAAKKTENAANPKLAWFREHSNSNPLLLAQKVKCPILIVQGERDALVLPHHAVALAQTAVNAGNNNVSLRILPDLTHLFTPVSGSSEQSQKISLELLLTLQNWASTNLIEKTQKP